MSTVIWGDAQFHPWQETERPDRWRDILRVVDIVYQHAADIDAEKIVFLGDMFETKRSVRSDVFSAVHSRFYTCAKKYNIPHILLCGNHDIYRDRKDSLLHTFLLDDLILPVVNDYVVLDEELFVPFGVDVPEDTEYRYMYTHAEIEGCFHTANCESSVSGIPAGLLAGTRLRQCVFNGHYHSHQIAVRDAASVLVECVGAPFHHCWRDVATGSNMNMRRRGFVVLHDNDVHDFISLDDEFPRFVLNCDKDTAKTNDFVEHSYEQDERKSSAVARDDELGIGTSMDPTNSIPGYVSYSGVDKKRQKPLTDMGIELYRQGNSET